MDNYTVATDKLFEEIKHLDRMGFRDIDLALAQAKRVRTASTLVVRALARHRDQLQSQEDTSE